MGALAFAHFIAEIVGGTILSSLICTFRDFVILLLRFLSFGYYSHFSPIVSCLYGMPTSISWFNSHTNSNRPIHSIQIKPFDSSRGRSSDTICEGSITYSKDSIPFKAILKCSQTGLLGRFKAHIRGAFREGLVYDSNLFSHAQSSLKIPKLVMSNYSSLLSESVLLIEDLRSNKYGFNAVDVFGSLKHPPKYSKDERKYVLDMIVKQLAAMHARHYNNYDLLKSSFHFLSGSGFYKNLTDTADYSRNECKYNFSMYYTKMKWKKAKKRLEKNKIEWLNKDSTGLTCENSMDFPLQISTKVIAYIEEALAMSTYKNYLESIRKRPFSLCHADVHGDNIFISPSAKCKSLFDIKPTELYYFDLQEAGINDPGNYLLTYSYFIEILIPFQYQTLQIYLLLIAFVNTAIRLRTPKSCFGKPSDCTTRS